MTALRKLRVAHKLESNIIDNDEIKDVTEANALRHSILDLTTSAHAHLQHSHSDRSKGKQSVDDFPGIVGGDGAMSESCVVCLRMGEDKKIYVRIGMTDKFAKVFDAFFAAYPEHRYGKPYECLVCLFGYRHEQSCMLFNNPTPQQFFWHSRSPYTSNCRHRFRFSFDGNIVEISHTPTSLDMAKADENLVEAVLQQPAAPPV